MRMCVCVCVCVCMCVFEFIVLFTFGNSSAFLIIFYTIQICIFYLQNGIDENVNSGHLWMLRLKFIFNFVLYIPLYFEFFLMNALIL
jgi:hypothetical protein